MHKTVNADSVPAYMLAIDGSRWCSALSVKPWSLLDPLV